eukprot:COSAG05_NODE_1827_length_4009_cov_4.717391_2_plen_103_part_00
MRHPCYGKNGVAHSIGAAIAVGSASWDEDVSETCPAGCQVRKLSLPVAHLPDGPPTMQEAIYDLHNACVGAERKGTNVMLFVSFYVASVVWTYVVLCVATIN